jgi:adenylate kinase family enzyme
MFGKPSAAAERIYVIGGPGSGKTTLAREIGRRAGLPVHELDSVHWLGKPTSGLRPADQREALIEQIIGSRRWVVEGVYIGWTTALLDAADTIIWLDHIGWPRVTIRVVKRSFGKAFGELLWRRRWQRFEGMRGIGRRLRNVAVLLHATRAYHRSPDAADPHPAANLLGASRTATAALLARYEHKLVHCRTTSDVEAAFEQLIPSVADVPLVAE